MEAKQDYINFLWTNSAFRYSNLAHIRKRVFERSVLLRALKGSSLGAIQSRVLNILNWARYWFNERKIIIDPLDICPPGIDDTLRDDVAMIFARIYVAKDLRWMWWKESLEYLLRRIEKTWIIPSNIMFHTVLWNLRKSSRDSELPSYAEYVCRFEKVIPNLARSSQFFTHDDLVAYEIFLSELKRLY